MDKTMKARVQHKHDIKANWEKAINFIPLAGEIIVYDPDEKYTYSRVKIGDGVTVINLLPFVVEDIDYETSLAFDVTEIVFEDSSSSILGKAVLGRLVLA